MRGRRLLAVIPGPIALDDLGNFAKTYPDSQLGMGQGGYWVTTRGDWCPCITCENELAEDYERLTGDWLNRGFIVCPECGNKRCPKATLHDNACTGSNEPGQQGSVFA
jgi:hypothetical protein